MQGHTRFPSLPRSQPLRPCDKLSINTVNPLLGEGVLFIPSPFERDLIETGWGLRALNYLEMPMVSVHHNELEYNVEELK